MTQHMPSANDFCTNATTSGIFAAIIICPKKRRCAAQRRPIMLRGLPPFSAGRFHHSGFATSFCHILTDLSYIDLNSSVIFTSMISKDASLKLSERAKYCPVAFICMATSSMAPIPPLCMSAMKSNWSLKEVPGPQSPRRLRLQKCLGSLAPVALRYTMRPSGSCCWSEATNVALLVALLFFHDSKSSLSSSSTLSDLALPLPIFLARWHSSKITAPSKESAPHQSIICCSRARSTFLLPTRSWMRREYVQKRIPFLMPCFSSESLAEKSLRLWQVILPPPISSISRRASATRSALTLNHRALSRPCR
mmetsp:Transcript_52160/g.84302  ORF Transcript_52160/g.84302 Transcript_52160/m.84302 type:complete len:308 (-) Transcript_52160:1339-2262(-)